MPKTIPAALVTHKSQATVTTSYLLKIGPTPAGTYLSLTSLDRNEVYDDGIIELTYYANSGVQLSTLESTNDLSVDNGEAQSLITLIPDTGITQAMVDQGLLDTVEFVIYEHDYLGGAAEEHEIMGSGVLGRCRVVQGILVAPELRSWTQLLYQTGIISATSIPCRVKRFGSQAGEEREFCGYSLAYEWIPFTVTEEGAEPEREFSASGLGQATDYFAPGLVSWTAGANAGTSQEVESFTAVSSGGEITLRFLTNNPIAVGDEGEIRRDCTRNWAGHNSCTTYFASDRGAHFRGEPNINIGDSIANSIPGVNSTNTSGGTGEAAL